MRLLVYFTLLSFTTAAEPSFLKDIAPLLADQCLECHRADKRKGDFQLHTFQALLKEKPSHLLALVTTDDEDARMPPKGSGLNKEQASLLQRWITAGAKYDGPDPSKPWLDLLKSAPIKVQPTGKPMPVTALAAVHGTDLIASNGYAAVILWHRATGQRVSSIEDMPERVLALAAVPHTSLLAVAGGVPGRRGEVWLVDSQKKQPSKKLLTTTDTVQAVAVSPDGKRLACAGTDRHTRCYSLPEGKLLWDKEAHADWVLCLEYSPDGKLLAAGSRDRTAKLFLTDSGEVSAAHVGHEAAVTSLCFFDNGKSVVSGDSEGYVRRWNLEGKSDNSTTTRPGRQPVLAMLATAERTFISYADKGLGEQDVRGKKVKRLFPGTTSSRVNALTSYTTELPEKKMLTHLVSGSHDGSIRVWLVPEAQLSKEWLLSSE